MSIENKLRWLASAVVLSFAIVALLVILAWDSVDDEGPVPDGTAGVAETRDLLRGNAARSNTVGNAGAPVRIVVFADLKDQAWQAWWVNKSAAVVRQNVRSGDAVLEVRLVNDVDRARGTTDGARARTVAYNFAGRGQMITFISLLAYNQGSETSEWAMSSRLAQVAEAEGLSVLGKINTNETADVVRRRDEDDAAAQEAGVRKVPGVVIQSADGSQRERVSAEAGAIRSAVRRISD